jgi:predicted adenine nucleotide alpha hydrolase (AANH) superfamily ATPase
MDRDAVLRVGRQMGKEAGIEFIEADWRDRYKESIKVSKERNIYRQNYCGCIYSEAERFAGLDFKKPDAGRGKTKKSGKDATGGGE